MHPAEQYAADVLAGKILACKYVKLACQRYFDDLDNADSLSIYFDQDAAEHAIGFFSFLKHSKGEFAGQTFELEPWQQFVIWNLFGWKNADGFRRFTDCYVEVARKNGKSTLASGIANYCFIADGEGGPEVYAAATKKDQAKIVFDEAKRMVMASPALKTRVGIHMHNMHIIPKAAKFEPLSNETDSMDGLNPHCAIVDEYHAHKNNELVNVIQSGMGARRQPLLFKITTAGFNKQGPCFKHRRVCIDILEGRKEAKNLFCIIFTLDKGDNWLDESVWIKANPSMDSIPTVLKFIREQVQKALNNPSDLVEVLTKNLNKWVDASETWIESEKWAANYREYTAQSLRGHQCFGGLDLASVSDITALHLLFPEPDGTFKSLAYYWIPEETVKRRVKVDGVAYDQWVRDGHLLVTPGNVTDYSHIQSKYKELAEYFGLVSTAYDRWNSSQLVINLQEDGATLTPMGQGYQSISTPTKELEKLVLEEKFHHDGNPVAAWSLGNVVLARDPAGNIKPSKKDSQEKIDPTVAGIMAIGEYLTWQAENMPVTVTVDWC